MSKKIICDFCDEEVNEKQLFLDRNTRDSLNVVLDSFDDWENGESNFDVCKKCIKKIGKKFFNLMADKYCCMDEDEEFIRKVWDKKVKNMLKELQKCVKQKQEESKRE